MKRILVPALALLLLGGCVSNGTGPNQTMGTLVGAAAGGLAGSQFGSGNGRLAATAAGTLLGAYAGNQWGSAVDGQNQTYYAPPPPHRHPGHDRRSYRRGQRDGYDHGYNDGYGDGYGSGYHDGYY